MLTFDPEISDFLKSAPLYKKHKTKTYIDTPYDFHLYGVTIYCSHEKTPQTHELNISPDSALEYYEKLRGDMPAEDCVNQNDGKLFFVQHYRGICKSCKKHSIDFLLEVQSDKSIFEKDVELTLRKIGQDPPIEITPPKEFTNYLDKPDLDNYKKAMMNLSHNFGIGSYAYLRRIVENEILKLLKDVSELKTEHSAKLQELLKKHSEEHSISRLIDESYKFLPESLKSLGENPFKLLYSELSIGIHKLADDECLNRAQGLNSILKFVIKRIYEEKNEVLEVREAIKRLSKKRL